MDREQRIRILLKNIIAGDGSLIYELWKELEGLCGWYCRKLLYQLPEAFKLEYDDLFNCGFIALCDALKHYSPERNDTFSYYYLLYLTGAIYRENRLSSGGHYTDGQRRFDPIITGGTISLDAPTDESQDNPEPLYYFLGDDPATDMLEKTTERIYIQQLHDVLENLITMLPEWQQYVIRQKYYVGEDCARIAEVLRIRRNDVYTLEDKALISLRKNGKAAGLEKFLNDEIDYYAGTGLTRFNESGSSSTERIALKRIELESRFELLSKCIAEMS